MTERPSPDAPPPPSPDRPSRRERRSRTVGWGTSDILRAAALILLLYLFLRLLWFANALVFVVFLGILFGLAVTVAVDRLEELRVPRGVGAGLTVLGFFALLTAFGVLMAPTLREQAGELRRRLPEAVDRIDRWIESRRDGSLGFLLRGLMTDDDSVTAPAPNGRADTADRATSGDTVRRDSAAAAEGAAAARTAGERETAVMDSGPPSADESVGDEEQPGITLRERFGSQLDGIAGYFFSVLSSTLAVMSGVVLIIFLAIFIAADPGLYHRGLLHLFPHQVRPRIGEVLNATATMLRRWLLTQLIGMTTIGVVTTIVLLILGVEAAFALGLLAGVLEFIPTIGPLLSAVPAIAMGFLDSPQTALYVALAYIAIQFLESNLLMPMLMQEGVHIPPALSIAFQALMALLFGFLGLLVAVPLLAAALVPIRMLYVEDVVGDQVAVLETDDEGDEDDEHEPGA